MTLQPTSKTWVTWFENPSDKSLHKKHENKFWEKLLRAIFFHKMVCNAFSMDMGHHRNGMEKVWNKVVNPCLIWKAKALKIMQRRVTRYIVFYSSIFQGKMPNFLSAHNTNLFEAPREKVNIISIFHIPFGKVMYRNDCSYHSIKCRGWYSNKSFTCTKWNNNKIHFHYVHFLITLNTASWPIIPYNCAIV